MFNLYEIYTNSYPVRNATRVMLCFRARPDDLAGLAVEVAGASGNKNDTSQFGLPDSFPMPRSDYDLNVEVIFMQVKSVKYHHVANDRHSTKKYCYATCEHNSFHVSVVDKLKTFFNISQRFM